jgi:hypothetical protein
MCKTDGVVHKCRCNDLLIQQVKKWRISVFLKYRCKYSFAIKSCAGGDGKGWRFSTCLQKYTSLIELLLGRVVCLTFCLLTKNQKCDVTCSRGSQDGKLPGKGVVLVNRGYHQLISR